MRNFPRPEESGADVTTKCIVEPWILGQEKALKGRLVKCESGLELMERCHAGLRSEEYALVTSGDKKGGNQVRVRGTRHCLDSKGLQSECQSQGNNPSILWVCTPKNWRQGLE